LHDSGAMFLDRFLTDVCKDGDRLVGATIIDPAKDLALSRRQDTQTTMSLRDPVQHDIDNVVLHQFAKSDQVTAELSFKGNRPDLRMDPDQILSGKNNRWSVLKPLMGDEGEKLKGVNPLTDQGFGKSLSGNEAIGV